VSVGELCNVWHQSVLGDGICGCGEVFSACPFWRRVGEVSFGGWHKVDAPRLRMLRRRFERPRQLPFRLYPQLSPGVAAELGEYRALTVQLYQGIAEVSGCNVIVDNSKLATRVALLHGTPELDLRVLHLVRSSYAVCYSWSKHVARADAQQQMLRYPIARSAVQWTLVNVAFELLARRGVPTLPLRYEEFVAQPAGELRRIFAFLGQPAGIELPFVHGHAVDLTRDHSVWGNPIRVRVGWETLSADDAWRAALAPRAHRVITALTAPGLRRYGYTGRRQPPAPA